LLTWLNSLVLPWLLPQVTLRYEVKMLYNLFYIYTKVTKIMYKTLYIFYFFTNIGPQTVCR
jgi:hypothetical protein